jgi:putative ABC transport system ATP-binding protein
MTTSSFDILAGQPVRAEAALIDMRGVRRVFHTTAGEFTILKGIDVTIRSGEFVSIVGRSGSGKSTLANMLTGIDHPSSGTVRVGDVFIHKMSESNMSEWRGRELGIVFQFFQLLPMLSLLENVMLPMDFCNMYAPEKREERALQLLQRVGLEEFAHKLPGAVSGGQQQSAAVARALANDPPVIVADEPTGNLDSKTAESIIQLFEELVAGGKTILMVTHDRLLAQRANRILVISDGELVREPVSRAFPNIPHEQMLALSHGAAEKRLAPGEVLLGQGDGAAQYYLVTAGVLETFQSQNGSGTAILERTGAGQALDPVAARQRLGLPAGVRAAGDGPVDLLIFEREQVHGYLTPAAQAPALPDAQKKPAGLFGWLNRSGKKAA